MKNIYSELYRIHQHDGTVVGRDVRTKHNVIFLDKQVAIYRMPLTEKQEAKKPGKFTLTTRFHVKTHVSTGNLVK